MMKVIADTDDLYALNGAFNACDGNILFADCISADGIAVQQESVGGRESVDRTFAAG